LFIAGVSFPFSLDKRRENNQSDRVIYKHSFKRVVTLIILGLIYNGLLKLDLHTARYASVLAHIGIAWFIASIIFMNVKKYYYYMVDYRNFNKLWVAESVCLITKCFGK